MRSRPTAAVALLYAVLSLAMFLPGLVPGRTLSSSDYLWTATPWSSSRPAHIPALGANRETVDSVVQFQPALLATRHAFPDVPLWDPYTLSGRPFLGDPQSAVFSPFSVPAYILPFWKSLAVMAALKLFIAAFGAFLLGRALGMRIGGALLTGLVYGFSLWSVTWVSWPHGGVWALLPWLCLLTELLVRRPGPLPFAGLAGLVGVQFLAGHPASSFQVLAVVVLFWAGRVLLSGFGARAAVARLLWIAGALAAGVALAAVALLPFAELLSHSSDATSRAEASDLLHQPSRYLLGLFLHDWWGHAKAALDFGPGLEERAYYVGALPLLLAALALVLNPRRERIAVAAVGAVALACATGISPFYDVLVALPGFDAANNGRMAVIAVLGLAVLAGWGADDLFREPIAGRRRQIAIVTVVVLALLPVAIAVGSRDFGRDALGSAIGVASGLKAATVDEPAVLKLASLLEWVVPAALGLALLALALRRRLGAAAFVAAAAVLITLDLFRAGMGYNPSLSLDDAVQPTTPALRFLQDHRPARFAVLEAKKPLSLAHSLPPNVSMRWQLDDVRGYVIPTEERYFNLWSKVISPGCYYLFCTQDAPAKPRAFGALGLLGVGYLLQNHGDPPLTSLRAAYTGPDARIYSNPAALPRAFMVDRQVEAPGPDAALAAVTSESFRPRDAAVVERPIRGLGGSSGGSAGSARIDELERERVVVRTSAAHPALLVLTDPWYPGWKATVDGKSAPIHRVDYLLRGVQVPAGAHSVEFRYQPASWRAGWIVSLLALLGLGSTALVGWRRERARR
jgi:Bacterial membrane protein YfhO